MCNSEEKYKHLNAHHCLSPPCCFARPVQTSHVCTFGMVGGWRNGVGSLLGVVESVVVSVRSGAFGAAAGDHTAPQQTEGGAYPSGVERESKRHETLLSMGTDREPHRGDNPTQGYDKDEYPAKHRAFVFSALWFVSQVDAGHGAQHERHSGQTKDRRSDHQSTRSLDVSR